MTGRTAIEVTVVIPTLGRPTLPGSVRSALRSGRDLRVEVLVVDDRPRDERTARPLTDVSSVGGPVRVLHGNADGASAARNVALDQARGDWVAFLDDDDLMFEAHLPSLLAVARSSEARLVHSGVLVGLPDGTRPVGFGWAARPELLWVANVVPPSAALVRRDGLTERFEPELQTLEDWAMWLQVASVGSVAYTGLASCLYQHRASADQPSAEQLSRLRSGLSSLHDNYGRLCRRFDSDEPEVVAGRRQMNAMYAEWGRLLAAGIAPPADHYERALAKLFGPPRARLLSCETEPGAR